MQKLFDWYLTELWTPWAEAEKPRRRTMALYNKLFSVQQVMAMEGAETPLELVWGLGQSVWKRAGTTTTVRHPLISQICEVALDAQTFALEVRPREARSILEVDPYTALEVQGVGQLEAFWRSESASRESRISPFEHPSFERVLRAAVGYLDPTGRYLQPDNRQAPPSAENLCITDTWVLFARRRSDHIFLQDITRLKKALDANPKVPPVLAGFVTHGSAEVEAPHIVNFRGVSSGGTVGSGVSELFFPIPDNDEQVAIAQQLETRDGVVVQGPPGTGKTHTIANIVCHYLALGKRVLVTSKGESALAVVQQKLPEEVRALCVALLSDERDGMKQFEHSIQTIASKVGALQPNRIAADINLLQSRLDELHQSLAAVNNRVAAYAAKHMRTYPFKGRDTSPAEMAQFVVSNESEYGWLVDVLSSKKNGELRFSGNRPVSTLLSRC